MKRTIAILLAVLMVLSMAACSASENYPDDEIYDEVPEGSDIFLEGSDFVRDTKDESEWNQNGNTASNYFSRGSSVAVQQGDWIYYLSYNQIGNYSCIYKTPIDSTQEDILIAEVAGEAFRISVVGNTVYFLDSGGHLNAARTDGGAVSLVFDDPNINTSSYVILDRYLYVMKKTQLSASTSRYEMVRYPVNATFDTEHGEAVREIKESTEILGFTDHMLFLESNKGTEDWDVEFISLDTMKSSEEDRTVLAGFSEDDFEILDAYEDEDIEEWLFYGDTMYFIYGGYETLAGCHYMEAMGKMDFSNKTVELIEFPMRYHYHNINVFEEDRFLVSLALTSQDAFGWTHIDSNKIGIMTIKDFEAHKYSSVIEDSAYCLSAVDNWIYYRAAGEESHKVDCRVRMDGTSWQTV